MLHTLILCICITVLIVLFCIREDFMLAQDLKTEEEKQQLYMELKSGAESGWDYSTRWFVNNETNNGELVCRRNNDLISFLTMATHYLVRL